MTFRLASLGSGSKGNGTLVAFGEALFLVDCGFTLRDTEARLARLGVSPEALTGVLVTHEHGDHARGVGPLSRRHKVPVFASFGTARALSEGALRGCEVEELRPGRVFNVGAVAVHPVPVPHDAREPCQFVFDAGAQRVGVLTDLGHVTGHVVEQYSACDALVLECNHDEQMLAQGPYPPSLKRRVGGNLGHLNNRQSAALLAQLDRSRLQHLVLSHLSEQNNSPALALAAIEPVMAEADTSIQVACQAQGFGWLSVN